MLNLMTDKMGFLRFAAISGIAPARLGDLTWFYRTLPHLGVTKLLRVESGVPLIENVPAEPSEPALVALTPLPRYTGSLDDLRIVHGASEGSTKLITYSGQYCRATLASRVRRRTRRLDEDCAPPGHSEIILVGGDRRPGHRYYHNPTEEQWERRDARQGSGWCDREMEFNRKNKGALCCAIATGVFGTPLNFKHPPWCYGGTIVEVQLHLDGTLKTCVARFRDMSGRLPDIWD